LHSTVGALFKTELREKFARVKTAIPLIAIGAVLNSMHLCLVWGAWQDLIFSNPSTPVVDILVGRISKVVPKRPPLIIGINLS
jgi:hypothetical protein